MNTPSEDLKSLRKEVESTMKESEAVLMTGKEIARYNNDILVKLVYIFFKIIKSQKISKFYQSALNGLLKFIHFINVDLVEAGIDCLY